VVVLLFLGVDTAHPSHGPVLPFLFFFFVYRPGTACVPSGWRRRK
jgi:hypothetical protein